MNEAVIVEAVRTPFGRRGGRWADRRPDDLLADAIQGLLGRAGLPPGPVSYTHLTLPTKRIV